MRGLAAGFIGALILAVSGCSAGGTEELTPVEVAHPRLLDDGAGQRYFEVAYPVGEPRGTIILIHGEGWTDQGPARFEADRDRVASLTSMGFRVVATSNDQSPALTDRSKAPDGDRVLDDVLAFHDQVRTAFGDRPLCAMGTSGGGHLALMLAVERPGLDCVIAEGAPTELNAVVRDAKLGSSPGQRCNRPRSPLQFGACLAVLTWGYEERARRAASPAARWSRASNTAVWAGFETEDPVIPDSQRRALEQNIAGAVIETLRPDPNGPAYAHSGVRAEDKQAAKQSRSSWLKAEIPAVDGEVLMPDSDLREGTHTACNARLENGPSWADGRRRDRADLLTANGRWRTRSDTRVLLAANSCDGRDTLQTEGLTISASGFQENTATLVKAGAKAAWEFAAPGGSVISEHRATFRGFLAAAPFWKVSLLARESGSAPWTSLVSCGGGECEGFAAPADGVSRTIAPEGTTGDPDQADRLRPQAFQPPPGTTQLRWELECTSPKGCLPTSINPGSNPVSPNPARPLDPTGRPAVISLYSLEVDTVGD